MNKVKQPVRGTGRFRFYGQSELWDCYPLFTTWNGWDNVAVTLDTLKKMVEFYDNRKNIDLADKLYELRNSAARGNKVYLENQFTIKVISVHGTKVKQEHSPYDVYVMTYYTTTEQINE